MAGIINKLLIRSNADPELLALSRYTINKYKYIQEILHIAI